MHKLREGKISVREAVNLVNRDCETIRERTGIRDVILTQQDIERLSAAAKEFVKDTKIRYSPYEIGHRFILEHLVASVKKNVDLDENEERLFREALGSLHYNPPAGEYIKMAEAAEELNSMGRRGKEIFNAFEAEAKRFREMLLSGIKLNGTDIFTNPAPSVGLYGDFGQFAMVKKATAKRVSKTSMYS